VRLFVALEVPAEVRETIAALIRELKPLDASWKWTRAENLHITLKFLGEISIQGFDEIVAALTEVPFEQSLTLCFRGLGFFPNDRRPRVLWVGIEGPPGLLNLARNVEDSLTGVGVERDDRAFTPHLTLARSKEGRVAPQLRETLTICSGRNLGTVVASAFHLVRSDLKSTGAEYTTLASFPCRQGTE